MKKMLRILIILLILLTICILAIISVSNKENNDEMPEVEVGRQEYFEPKEKYEYNEFQIQEISTEGLIDKYFIEYKNKALYNVQKGYELLDDEYKTKRFGTLEVFDAYINEKAEELYNAKIQSFTTEKYEAYTEYICIDQYENYYIFQAYGIAKYKVILDNYTVDTMKFIQEYNEADNEEKAAMNLNRFLSAIENKDYKYAYGKLYSTFRNNNFPTQLDFENYINQNIINYEDIEAVEVENQSGIYICKLSIVDANKVETERTFMIQLMEDTEYQISFTI